MLKVQELHNQQLSIGGIEAFRDAVKQLGIDIRDYPEHQMMLLDYNQIEAVKNHPVVNECRGLLMGYDGSIIRKGFTRFYNLGENGVDTFDFENSVVFEKADGSLCFVYYCAPTRRWEIGTRGTAFAEGPNEWHGTFRKFMLNAMGRTEEQFQAACDNNLWRHKTYLFEAVGPDNRIVTKYDENQLVFLAAVDPHLMIEEFNKDDDYISLFSDMGWNVRAIREYSFNTQEDCIVALHELTGLQEGYVAYNKLTGMRVKIKSPTYLAAHRLRGNNGLTVNSICELVVMNEQDEYLAVFPEDAPKFEIAFKEYKQMIANLNWAFGAAGEHMKQFADNSQKEFALFVKDLPMSAVLFKARANNTAVEHEFNQFPVSRRTEWLKSKVAHLYLPSTVEQSS